MDIENAIVIINKTRLELLIERFNTKAQAKFYIEHAGGNFIDYEAEHDTFHRALDDVTNMLHSYVKLKIIERKFLPKFLFSEKDVAIVVGQDGLVANTAKYARGIPILAINPDVNRYDGILLPFHATNFQQGLINLLKGRARFNYVTMAEARTNDGQRLLAFNDLFIGPSSHISARYRLSYQGEHENQSSSGIIVSTGAGATGWLSSLFNMANSIQSAFSTTAPDKMHLSMNWHDNKLVFVVREPFQSKYSRINLSAGIIHENDKLCVESFMPSHGIIFSDGIEADYIAFNSGTQVEIGIAEQKAMLVEHV